MSDLFWRSDEQTERLQPFFPESHSRPRVDDRRVLSGITFVNKNGLRWRDAERLWSALDASQLVEALGRRGCIHSYDEGAAGS